MNKRQRQQIEQKIATVEETLVILKHQESNLLEVIIHHNYDHNEKEIKKWVQEIFIGCEYIVRLEESLKLLKDTLPPRRKRGGKKKD